MSSRRFKMIGDYRGTVQACRKFDPESDARRMFDAIRSDTDDLIELASSRSMAQRMEIVSIYESCNGSMLFADMKRKIKSKKFRTALVALFIPPEESDARKIHNALRNRENHVWICDILKTRDHVEIDLIRVMYEDIYEVTLKDEIKAKIGGDLAEFYIKILNGSEISQADAAETASTLHDSMKNLSHDEARTVVSEIFAKKSINELKNTIEEYSKNWNSDLAVSIQSKFHGEICEALLMVVEMASNLPLFYARRLKACEKKSKFRYDHLMSLIVSRCEIDTQDIRIAFWNEFQITLDSFVQRVTRNKFRKILTSLVKP